MSSTEIYFVECVLPKRQHVKTPSNYNDRLHLLSDFPFSNAKQKKVDIKCHFVETRSKLIVLGNTSDGNQQKCPPLNLFLKEKNKFQNTNSKTPFDGDAERKEKSDYEVKKMPSSKDTDVYLESKSHNYITRPRNKFIIMRTVFHNQIINSLMRLAEPNRQNKTAFKWKHRGLNNNLDKNETSVNLSLENIAEHLSFEDISVVASNIWRNNRNGFQNYFKLLSEFEEKWHTMKHPHFSHCPRGHKRLAFAEAYSDQNTASEHGERARRPQTGTDAGILESFSGRAVLGKLTRAVLGRGKSLVVSSYEYDSLRREEYGVAGAKKEAADPIAQSKNTYKALKKAKLCGRFSVKKTAGSKIIADASCQRERLVRAGKVKKRGTTQPKTFSLLRRSTFSKDFVVEDVFVRR